MQWMWNFVKSNWKIILQIAIIVGSFVWIFSRESKLADVIQHMNDTHQVEIDKINQVREQEKKEHAAEARELKEAMTKIEAEYAAAQAELAKRSQKQQVQMVKKYENDMVGLAQAAASELGLVAVDPSK